MFAWVVSCFILLVWFSYGRYLLANTWLAHFVPVFLGLTWVGARGCSWLRVFLSWMYRARVLVSGFA